MHGKQNQDDFFVEVIDAAAGDCIVGVFDGHGRELGQLAARTAKDYVRGELRKEEVRKAIERDPKGKFDEVFVAAHKAIEAVRKTMIHRMRAPLAPLVPPCASQLPEPLVGFPPPLRGKPQYRGSSSCAGGKRGGPCSLAFVRCTWSLRAALDRRICPLLAPLPPPQYDCWHRRLPRTTPMLGGWCRALRRGS